MGILDLPDIPQSPKTKYRFGNIPVVYELMGLVDEIDTDYLPSYLSVPPKVGDIIESTNERRFEIKEIIHTMSDNVAALRLSIGKQSGGISPDGGGGGAIEVE